jgi:hypothetical protein
LTYVDTSGRIAVEGFMRRLMRLGIPAAGILAVAGIGFGQLAISVKAGLVNYVEGDVFLQDKAVTVKLGEFPQIKPEQVLRTDEGRAEVLLTPGSFLRLAENSSVKMVSDTLADVRVEPLKGDIMVEISEQMKDTKVSLMAGKCEVLLDKAGVFRLDKEQGILKVYSGEALVRTPNGPLEVKAGRELQLNDSLLVAKFDKNATDIFYRWNMRRSGDIATANISAARTVNRSGNSWMGGWLYNPYYGMYSYVPMSGYLRNPFGYYFWSPYEAGGLYLPPYYYGVVTPTVARGGWTGGHGGTAVSPGYSSLTRGEHSSFSGYNNSGAVSSSSSYGYTPAAHGATASAPVSSGATAGAAVGSTRSGGDAGGGHAGGGGRR